MTDPAEKTVLVLQGGGALGAYQAGAYEALAMAVPKDFSAPMASTFMLSLPFAAKALLSIAS